MTNNNDTEQQEWKASRRLIVGASEISAVIRATSSEEDIKKAMGESTQDFMDSKDFATGFEIWNEKKGYLESKPFPKVQSKFGHGMEKFAEFYINRKFGDYMNAQCQPQKVLNSDLHKLAGYTPDLFAKFLKDDENFRGVNIKEGDRCVVEVKTTGFFQAIKDKLNSEGSKWAYIQQVQYQGMQEKARDPRYKWTMLFHIIPLEAEFDDDFTKGQACMACDNIENGGYEWILKHYDVNFWIFPVYESLRPLFINALNVWDNMLEHNIEPQPDFLRDCTDVSKLFKDNMPEIISKCKVRYGIDGGIVPIEMIEKSAPDLFDKIKIFYENKSESKKLNDDCDIQKTEILTICKKLEILGIDDQNNTMKIQKSGNGITLKCQFKTKEEIENKEIAKDKF